MKRALTALAILSFCMIPNLGHPQSMVSLCTTLSIKDANGNAQYSCVPVTAADPLPVTGGSGTPLNVTIVGPDGPEGGVSVSVNPYRKDANNFSGTIAVGGAWQQVIPSNPLRSRIFLQNRCSALTQGIAASESMFLNLGPNVPTSTDGAIEITTCGVYDSSSFVLNTQPVWLMAASTGHKFVALEW